MCGHDAGDRDLCRLLPLCKALPLQRDANWSLVAISPSLRALRISQRRREHLFCSSPMVALSRNVSRENAMEMLLTGTPIPAQDASHMGLVNRVVDPEMLMPETEALAQQIASKSPNTMRIGKDAAEVMVMNLMEPDAQEGVGAFVEKRTPEWQSLEPKS